MTWPPADPTSYAAPVGAAPDPTLPPGPPPYWSPEPRAGVDPKPPSRPWRRLRRVLVVAVVLGLLVAAGATAVAVQTVRDAHTPQTAVRNYFAALAGGDAASALAAGSVPAGGRALVSADVLRATLATAPIDDIQIGRVSLNGDAATVAVRYRLGGAHPQRVDDAVDLHRTHGTWRLARSAVPVSLSADTAASWAAAPATKPFALPTGLQLVFPGAAPVEYRSPLLEVDPTSRVVRLAETTDTLRVTAQLSEAGRATVTSTVVAALRACAAGGAGVDAYCPQPPAGRAGGVALRPVPQSFAGTLENTDQLSLDLAVGPESAGLLTVSGDIGVTGTWKVLDYDDVAQARRGTATITFGGTVAVGAPGVLTWDRS